jgi:hypothetical protein
MNAKRSRKRALLRNALHWDFLFSLFIAVIFLVFTLTSDRPLEDATGPITASITLGVAVALGAAVASRWLADRVKDDSYGEAIRARDPDESRAQAPYRIVTVAGVLAAAGGALLLISLGEMARTWTVIAYSVVLLLAMYSLFGMLDLLLLGHRHQRRQAVLRALREAENRRKEG